jgi:DNA-binding MarR family transcriptional regulator
MDAWTRFAENIFRLNGLLMQAGENITRPIGQSSARWQVLGGLGYGPKTVADIARHMGYARQSVQRVADILVTEGLVAQTEKPGDRRTFLLELTPAGQKVLGAIYERQVEWSNRITRTLSPEQLEALASALREIGNIVEADAKTNSDGGPTPPP